MKITIDVDCTPQEARAFLGLPDVEPMQTAMMNEIQRRMVEGLKVMDADALVKQWMPAGIQGIEAMQKMFWNQMRGAGKDPGDKDRGGGRGADD